MAALCLLSPTAVLRAVQHGGALPAISPRRTPCRTTWRRSACYPPTAVLRAVQHGGALPATIPAVLRAVQHGGALPATIPAVLPAARAVPYNMAAAATALVQYVVLRGDLSRPPLSWPLGAVVAQGCHAALAAVHGYREHPDTAAYLEQGDAMRTVVLEAPDERSLLALAALLRQEGLQHRLWSESPEGIPTGLALRPYPKNEVQPHLRNLKLLR